MVGDAAHQAERTSDPEIIGEVTSQLRNVFKHATVPDPLETIITRWGSDRFTRGSYSYVAAAALPEDYDLMARQVGNLHFAGEATCGTHPATVHGAYLSGLRAASEVIESAIGPIEIPNPLVPEKVNSSVSTTPNGTTTPAFQKRKAPNTTLSTTPTTTTPLARQHNPKSTEKSKEEAYTQAFWTQIYAELGPAPPRPAKAGLNPFLLYQKDYWSTCREQCDEARRTATKNTNARAARDEIRHALGQMWRNATADIKAPYLAQTEANRRANAEAWEKWKVEVTEWERLTYVVKDRWCAANPFETWQAGTAVSGDAAAGVQSNGVSHTS
jgi:lysine-specific histone demethylase 1